jgi:hypothetical protein
MQKFLLEFGNRKTTFWGADDFRTVRRAAVAWLWPIAATARPEIVRTGDRYHGRYCR